MFLYFGIAAPCCLGIPFPEQIAKETCGLRPMFIRTLSDSGGKMRCWASSCCTNSFTSARACGAGMLNVAADFGNLHWRATIAEFRQIIEPTGLRVSIEPPWISMSTAPSGCGKSECFLGSAHRSLNPRREAVSQSRFRFETSAARKIR